MLCLHSGPQRFWSELPGNNHTKQQANQTRRPKMSNLNKQRTKKKNIKGVMVSAGEAELAEWRLVSLVWISQNGVIGIL